MKIIVGLGNPGTIFEFTPHNIGFMLVDYLLKEWKKDILITRKELSSIVSHLKLEQENFLLVKPQIYMNFSGKAIQQIMLKYNINKENVLVLVDDINLESGSFKIKYKGGHGGHNGLRNIIDTLHSNEIKRLRIGVGFDDSLIPLKQYVLTRLKIQTQKKIVNNFPLFKTLIINFIKGYSFENLMNTII
jgi:PTH1 family peptidyl-tRNA hydrolase